TSRCRKRASGVRSKNRRDRTWVSYAPKLRNMDPFVHWVAGAVLVARLGDVVSTRLATPTLALEANPVARRLGWPLAWGSLLLCLVPYYDWRLGIMVAVSSFFVSGSNLSRVGIMRALGEREYLEVLHRAARRTTLGKMI